MILDRYYYQTFSDSDKQKYRMIYSGIERFESQIKIPKTNDKNLQKIIEAIIHDNPHLYYVDMHFYRYSQSDENTYIKFNYAFLKCEKERYQKDVNTEIVRIINYLKLHNKNEADIVLSIHDYLCESITYNKNAHTNNSLQSHTVIGALLNKNAVCDGYARSFKYLCNVMRIKCIVVIGRGIDRDMEGHAWNIVSINDIPCHVDVTWDSNLSNIGHPVRFYFGLSDNSIKKDHIMEFLYPECVSEKQDYMIQNEMIFNSKNELSRYLKKCILRKQEIIDFKLNITHTKKSFRSIVIENISELYQYNHKCSIQCEMVDLQNCCRLIVGYH